MDSADCVVIGAGVIGLSIAASLARRGRQVMVLERERRIGTGISARNSGVVHAGIYYPAASLKARLCVEGRRRLYAWCAARGVGIRRCGKLVVAVDEAETGALERLLKQGEANGVEGLRLLDGPEARLSEPGLRCAAALWSPQSGVVDVPALMLSLQADAEAHGAIIALATEVAALEPGAGGIVVVTAGPEPVSLVARTVINAAGLDAPALAGGIAALTEAGRVRQQLAKGSYFALQGRAPFKRLIYPLPEPGGLGVHLTLDLAGAARFGPDVEWVAEPDYRVEAGRAPLFEAAIRRWWPGLPDNALTPDWAGVRPKLCGPGDAPADFRIDGPEVHGIDGLVSLFGIESPGLTAALAIGEHVAGLTAA